MTRHAKRGFTLVEIMIVVAIIALLAAIAIPNVLRGRTTANESASIGNLRALLSSLEMYRSVYQAYPSPDGAAFKTGMYGANCTGASPEPDYGPPSFCKTLDGSVGNALVQGYQYTYAGVGGTTYTLQGAPQSGSTGSRSFTVTEAGLIYHCSGTTPVTAAQIAAGGVATIDQAPLNCP